MRAICPGSFDPVTCGHIDVIERAARVFGEVVVAVAPNVSKHNPLFSVEERMEMLREVTSHLPNVRIDSFHGLLVNYVKEQNAGVIVKGLRAMSDFEIEFQMALINRNLAPEVETVFMMTGAEYSYLSSNVVKEIAAFGGPVGGLVPDVVAGKLRDKISKDTGGHDK
jgi:pantetheine-phosphate adenylyltransferase